MPADAPPAVPLTPAPAATVTPAPTAAPPAAQPAAPPASTSTPPPDKKPDAPAATAPKQPKSLLDDADAGDPPKPGEAPKPGEPQKKDDAAAPKTGAPEAYTDFTLPEGMTLDPKLADQFKATAKELGLSQEGAQKLVSLQAEYAKSTAETLVSQAETQRAQQIEKWQTETKTALGADWKKELGYASKALDAFWPPEIRQLLKANGFGDHPKFVPGLVHLGKQISEGKPGEGSRAGVVDPKESNHRSMFPKMYDGQGNYIGGAK